MPRPRSASSSTTYLVDPYQYQHHFAPYSQASPQYTGDRRIVSGPPDVHYPDVQYLGTRRLANPAPRSPMSPEATLPDRESPAHVAGLEGYSDDDSSSEDHGVQVNVASIDRNYNANDSTDVASGRPRRTQR